MPSGYTVLFQIYIVFISVVILVNVIASLLNFAIKIRLKRQGYDLVRKRV